MARPDDEPIIPYVDIAAQSADQHDDLVAIFEAVLRDSKFVNGDAIDDFEAAVAAYCGVRHAVALNSGTDALMLGLLAVGVGRGDEVITPPNSFIASTAAVVHVGATPVFVDVLADQNIDPDLIEAAITPKTRAVMPVHLTGRPCRMTEIRDIARRHGLAVVEDAAQSVGSAYDGTRTGALGNVGCFSTHPLKNLNAIGDGGFVTTDDAEVAERIRRLRNHGMVDRATVGEFGVVSRMDTLQAAVLLYRLGHLPGVIEARRANAKRYQDRLANIGELFVPPCAPAEFNTFHTFVVQALDRDGLKRHLNEHGIRTNIHYPTPIHLQPAAAGLGYGPGDFPVTERQADHILTLPIHQYLSADDVDRVCDRIRGFYGA